MTRDPGSDLDRHVAVLAAAGVPSPGVDVRLLAEHVRDRGGSNADLEALVGRRAARWPLQLLLGEAWFRNVRVACEPGVFIPRPETEVVAGLAIDGLRALGRPGRVVEPCTGTGAITCALVTEVPGVAVVATELDPTAASLAARNVAAALAGEAGHPVADGATAQVLPGSLLEPVASDWRGTVDVLVSNPPYLPASDVGTWEPEVGDHDPLAALVGGPDGHEVVGALLVAATEWLRPGGLVVLEIDDRRGPATARAATDAGLVDVRVVPDLTGRDRAVTGRRRAA